MSATNTLERGGYSLLMIALQAPWCGVVRRQRRRPVVLHAIPTSSCIDGWEEGDFRRNQARFVSACGETGVAMIGTGSDPWLWPPRVATLPPSLVRCVECHKLTGRQRPRMWFEKRAAGSSSPDEKDATAPGPSENTP